MSGVRLCLWVSHFSLSRCSILWLLKVEESPHLDQSDGPCRNLVPGSQEDDQEEVILRCAFLNQQRFALRTVVVEQGIRTDQILFGSCRRRENLSFKTSNYASAAQGYLCAHEFAAIHWSLVP